MTTIVVFGGGGFLGRRLVNRLTAEGMTARVAVRHPDRTRIELRSMGLERVAVVPADVRDQASVAAASKQQKPQTVCTHKSRLVFGSGLLLGFSSLASSELPVLRFARLLRHDETSPDSYSRERQGYDDAHPHAIFVTGE